MHLLFEETNDKNGFLSFSQKVRDGKIWQFLTVYWAIFRLEHWNRYGLDFGNSACAFIHLHLKCRFVNVENSPIPVVPRSPHFESPIRHDQKCACDVAQGSLFDSKCILCESGEDEDGSMLREALRKNDEKILVFGEVRVIQLSTKSHRGHLGNRSSVNGR